MRLQTARSSLKTVSISQIAIDLDSIRKAESDSNFSGRGEILMLYANDSDDPVRLIVDDAEGLAEEIEKLKAT